MSIHETSYCGICNIHYENNPYESCPMCFLKQVTGVLCDECGWAMKFPDELCRCELEKENKKQRELLEDVVKLKDRYKLDIIYRIEQYLGEDK